MSEKKTRNKITLKFFLLMLAGGVFGGILGFTVTFLDNRLSKVAEFIHSSLLISSPWVLIGISLLSVLIALFTLQKGKRMSLAWNGEDEAAYEQIDKILGISMGTSSIGTILIMTWYGLLVISITSDSCRLAPFLTATVSFLAAEILHAFLQRKCVDVIKALNPEKQGDALSLHFQKEWLQSCDEQEKLVTYHACYKAFLSLAIVSMILIVILMLAAFLFDIGILPFLMIGILWLVPTIIYIKESMKNKPVL